MARPHEDGHVAISFYGARSGIGTDAGLAIATTGETEPNTVVGDPARVRGPGWWIVAVTVVDGPDEDHPIIIRLTLSTRDRREQRAVASIAEACDQLGSWLDEVSTEARR